MSTKFILQLNVCPNCNKEEKTLKLGTRTHNGFIWANNMSDCSLRTILNYSNNYKILDEYNDVWELEKFLLMTGVSNDLSS